jgi:hypothetical protein
MALLDWATQNVETIVVAVLTVVGFILQYKHFEGKISDRDQRDLFMRKVEEPVAQLMRDYSAAVSEVQVWLKRMSPEKAEDIFSRLVQINRAFNLMINTLNQSKFDLGDGWVALETERLEERLEAFDQAPSDSNGRLLIKGIDRFVDDVNLHLGRCRQRFAADT